MSKTIELPDEVFKDLQKVARERGLSPADWIAATLPGGSGSIEERSLSELLQGLIAAIDSTKGPQVVRIAPEAPSGQTARPSAPRGDLRQQACSLSAKSQAPLPHAGC
jgi:hypothetical protein